METLRPPTWRRRLRPWVVRLVLPLPVGAAVMLWQPHRLADLLARAEPRIVWRVETTEPLAALTFDDGPHPVHTPAVLAHLQRAGAQATFFLIGAHAREHPEIVAHIRREGHEVANHTDGGERSLSQDLARFQASVIAAERTLALDTASPRFFRAASGLLRPEQLEWIRGRGYLCVLGSAYPFDPARPPAAYMTWLVGKNLRPGAITILHEREHTAAALPQMLEAGRAKGLRFVTLSELWSRRRR